MTAHVPFEIEIGPLRQFCEVNFSGDPHYRSIELQRLAFDDGRDGMVVTMWRTDDVLDVYADPALGLDEAWWRREPALADIPMGELIDCDLSGATMQTGAAGCRTSVSFIDRNGRTVSLDAASTSTTIDHRRLFVPSVLRPRAELLRFLYIFELGPMSPDDAVTVSIDGVTMEPNRWMWPLGRRRHLQARHGDDMVLFSLNPPSTRSFSVDDPAIALGADGASVRSWGGVVVGHRVDLHFDPPVPLVGIGKLGQSGFEVTIDSERVTSGQIHVDGDAVRIVDTRQFWRPPSLDLSVWMLELVRRLKSRGKTWEWNGLFADGVAEGEWKRASPGG